MKQKKKRKKIVSPEVGLVDGRYPTHITKHENFRLASLATFDYIYVLSFLHVADMITVSSLIRPYIIIMLYTSEPRQGHYTFSNKIQYLPLTKF